MKPVKCVFVVDDDKIFKFLTRKAIEATYPENIICEFENGRTAIDHLKEIAGKAELLPDVIFLDLTMPVMNGWQFLDEYTLLRPQLMKEVTLYVCSSSINEIDKDRAKGNPEVTDFIVKPVSRNKVAEVLALRA